MLKKNGSMSVFAVVEGMPSDDKKIPLIREKTKDLYGFWPRLWKLPGGKVEPNEYPELTVIREISEEIGINIFPPENKDVFFSINLGDHTFQVYRVDYYGGELQAGEEIEEIRLFSFKEIEPMMIGSKILSNHAAAIKKYLQAINDNDERRVKICTERRN